jgi:hypothetical protein
VNTTITIPHYFSSNTKCPISRFFFWSRDRILTCRTKQNEPYSITVRDPRSRLGLQSRLHSRCCIIIAEARHRCERTRQCDMKRPNSPFFFWSMARIQTCRTKTARSHSICCRDPKITAGVVITTTPVATRVRRDVKMTTVHHYFWQCDKKSPNLFRAFSSGAWHRP